MFEETDVWVWSKISSSTAESNGSEWTPTEEDQSPVESERSVLPRLPSPEILSHRPKGPKVDPARRTNAASRGRRVGLRHFSRHPSAMRAPQPLSDGGAAVQTHLVVCDTPRHSGGTILGIPSSVAIRSSCITYAWWMGSEYVLCSPRGMRSPRVCMCRALFRPNILLN